MDEPTARDVIVVRALESADGAREIWSDADRVWAGRAAAEEVGESATDEAFLGCRAALAIERLRKRLIVAGSASIESMATGAHT